MSNKNMLHENTYHISKVAQISILACINHTLIKRIDHHMPISKTHYLALISCILSSISLFIIFKFH